MARAAEIKVMCANGLKPVLGAIAGRFEAASGDTLSMSFAETGELLRRINGGETADAYILPTPALVELAKQGKIAPEAKVDVASTTLGLAVREGAPKPETATVDAFRHWLLGVRSIVVTDPATGAIGSEYFLDLLHRLGLDEAMTPRLILTSGAGTYNAALVVSGKADAAVQLTHLIRRVRGVQIVPLPAEFALKVTFSAAPAGAATDVAGAERLIRFLSEPEALSVIEAAGLEPGDGTRLQPRSREGLNR